MKTISEHLIKTRSNIRPDEDFLARILSQIPEKKSERRLLSPYFALSPYMARFGAVLVSVFAFVIISIPIFDSYQAYRVENDLDLMALDESGEAVEWGINDLEDEMLMLK